jgi:glucose-6-phosphate 1-dehydrogenase
VSLSQVDPHLFVVFGGTGDLMQRKLLPALGQLQKRGLLGERHALLGVSRRGEYDDESFRAWARQALIDGGLSEKDVGQWCDSCLYYQRLGDGKVDDYRRLASRIDEIDNLRSLAGNRTFYLALPPAAFPPTITGLGTAALHSSDGWTRLVIEKPFGHDLASARELNGLAHRFFDESQIYRIDHYLGKETVQNLLVFRFANSIFESLWNRDRIANVQITVAESLGVEERTGYYDQAGALRDMVQNHATQLLSLVAMEVPREFSAEAVRYEKVKLLQAVAPIRPEDVVFGQYVAGKIGDQPVPGYREETGVPPGTRTETFAAVKLEIDTWRWQGVPFYIRSGKRMAQRLTQIAVSFRRPPVCLFESVGVRETRSNVLVLTLQPDEGFHLCVDVKIPGEPFELESIPLHFLYKEAFEPIPDAYQTLLLDVLTGDQTLFVHNLETEASWELYAPLIDGQVDVHTYQSGSWGPQPAEDLLASHGHTWLNALNIADFHDSTHLAGS